MAVYDNQDIDTLTSGVDPVAAILARFSLPPAAEPATAQPAASAPTATAAQQVLSRMATGDSGASVTPASPAGATRTSGPDPAASALTPILAPEHIDIPQVSPTAASPGESGRPALTPQLRVGAPDIPIVSPTATAPGESRGRPAGSPAAGLLARLEALRSAAPAAFRYGGLDSSDRGDAAKSPSSLSQQVGFHTGDYGLNSAEQGRMSSGDFQKFYDKNIAPFEAEQERLYGARNMFPLVLAVLGGALGPLLGPALGGALGLGSGLFGTAAGDAIMGGLTSAVSGGNPLMGALGGGLGGLAGGGLGSLLHGLGGAAGGAAGSYMAGTAGSDVLNVAGDVAGAAPTVSDLVVTGGLGGLGGLGAGIGGAVGGAAGSLGSGASGNGDAGGGGFHFNAGPQGPLDFSNPNAPGAGSFTGNPADNFRPLIFNAGPTGPLSFGGAGVGSTAGSGAPGDNTVSQLEVTAPENIPPIPIFPEVPLVNTPADIGSPPPNNNDPNFKKLGTDLIKSIGAGNPFTPPGVFPGRPPVPFAPPPGVGGPSTPPDPFTPPSAPAPPSGPGGGPDLGPGGSPGPRVPGPGGVPGLPDLTSGGPTSGFKPAASSASPFGGGGGGASGLGQINIKGSAAPDIYPWNTLTGGGLS